ncbi:unnamed protein product [Rhizoctonia solani]|uniref:Uncharacterized protein n=1 Tax=Rhizoctonia solani TaxID=456999 RepID=A0A8H2ZYP7_9AGAM|nr:unnamed protein product [Rhizoctonia solani]
MAAESARSSVTAIESKLRQKEHDLEAIQAELQSRRLAQTDTTVDVGATSLLQSKIIEQENAIENLRMKVLELEKNSEIIVERYKGGKLTNPEKDLVGVITAGIVQEKNRIINNLKGELKRRENELETNKAATASLKDSLAKQIKQTGELKVQLESNQTKDPAGWNSFNHKQMAVSSSPLSESLWHAPDHDPPAPDSPEVQSSERTVRNKENEYSQHYDSAHPMKPKAEQHRALVPIRLESGSAVDEIQEFEEPRTGTSHSTSTANRKRVTFNTEPTDDEEQEEHERETKRKTRPRKENKTMGESSGPKQPSNKTDGPSTGTKGKTAKRRKV